MKLPAFPPSWLPLVWAMVIVGTLTAVEIVVKIVVYLFRILTLLSSGPREWTNRN